MPTVTISGLTIENGNGVLGGGIANLGATLTITNSTFSGNLAAGGGGISTAPRSGLLTLKSTLFANEPPGGNCDSMCPQTSNGHNLSDDNSCGFNQATDQSNTPAELDTKGLQNNGGPTQTIALLPTSPAVDAIPVANCIDTKGDPVITDQRDIGA